MDDTQTLVVYLNEAMLRLMGLASAAELLGTARGAHATVEDRNLVRIVALCDACSELEHELPLHYAAYAAQ